ncbi:MAG: hypothetical protein C5B52_17535 [Bacteroidetes bacterium]|nr:MAG: hypothetical protein C5B52_17535 [Bacteroidota bacterium]
MKKLITGIAFVLFFCTTQSQDLKTPFPSPPQTINQDFGLSNVEVSYSRPGVKGRNIFGDLVPYGKVWRTGANNATTIQFGDDVTFGGTKVPAGKYGLLTIPDQGQWTVILTKQLDVTSPAAYKQDMDVARVTAKTHDLPFPIESFMILFDNITSSTMNLIFLWDKTAVSVPIQTDVDTKIMAAIDDAMNKDNRPYFASAMYYMNNGKDLNKANAWFDKAIQQQPDAFWVWHQKANCLAKLGKKQDAITAANKSIELAKAAKNDDYVALNNKLLATLK